MNVQELFDKWTGAYTYGNEYDEPLRGKTVTFEMKLTIVNGFIKGEVPMLNRPLIYKLMGLQVNKEYKNARLTLIVSLAGIITG